MELVTMVHRALVKKVETKLADQCASHCVCVVHNGQVLVMGTETDEQPHREVQMLHNEETLIVDGDVYFTNQAADKYCSQVKNYMRAMLEKQETFESGRGDMIEEVLVDGAAAEFNLYTSDGVYPQDLWEWAFEISDLE